ncbi:MAG: hypothetical protein Q8Q09_14140 [Deltaproteobacteria bacterium]|nr:hypothetical protein [Deltaproteobacteria bacterium]
MGLRTLGRLFVGSALGALVGLVVARRSAESAHQVFSLQRGPTMMALGIGAAGGAIAMMLSAHGHTKAGLTVALVAGLLLAFVVLVIQTNAVNAF